MINGKETKEKIDKRKWKVCKKNAFGDKFKVIAAHRHKWTIAYDSIHAKHEKHFVINDGVTHRIDICAAQTMAKCEGVSGRLKRFHVNSSLKSEHAKRRTNQSQSIGNKQRQN